MDTKGRHITLFGLFGNSMDGGIDSRRWSRWRPTLTPFMQDDVIVDKLVLIGGQNRPAKALVTDIQAMSPQTEIIIRPMDVKDPWDLEIMYGLLLDEAELLAHDPADGELWVHITTGTHIAQICLFLLVEAGFLPGQLLQTRPPRNGQIIGGCDLVDLNLARYDRIQTRFVDREQEATTFLKGGIVTLNDKFNKLISRIERVAVGSVDPLLLTGPTGAGKSHLARRIYELKRQRRQLGGPLVEVNCATLRGDQAMTALFGHRRGAFTGATEDRNGLLLTADKGMLFLDEIGELGLDEQAMLLGAIEDKRFLPVGSEREVQSDFQLIAGTNRDLRDGVSAGTFRADLLARIDLWHFELPGLRDRREDLEPNVDFELHRATRTLSRRITFNRQARQRYLSFAQGPSGHWNANFRDLQASITRMATLSDTGRISVHEVDEEVTELTQRWTSRRSARATQRRSVALLGDAAAELDRFDRVQLDDVLEVCSRSATLSAAGRELFAMSRARKKSSNDADRLRKYLARFGLSWAQVKHR
ncbi:MAG: transcriptional regulatory protein RtcR [Kiritimatiellia bacterium]|jgi:transcriptional regulatory protein RtcR